MLNIILCSDLKFSNILKKNIEVYLDISVTISKESLFETRAVKNETVLIVTKDISQIEVQRLIDFKKENAASKIFLVGSSDYLNNPDFIFLQKPEAVKQILRHLAIEKSISARDMITKNFPDFYHFESHLICESDISPVDLYIRDDESYRLIAMKGSTISNSLFLEIQGFKNFYVRSEDRLSLINALTETVLQTKPTQLRHIERSFITLQTSMLSIGIEQKTIDLANRSVKSIIALVKNRGFHPGLIQELIKNDSTFRFQMVMMTMYIGTKIIEETEWGSNDFLEKLGFICLFSDIKLTNDHLLKFRDNKSVNSSKTITKEDLLNIHTHAFEASNLFLDQKGFPIGLETMIKLHHGNSSGIGFEIDRPEIISPIVLIFMLSSDLAFYLLETQERNEKIQKQTFLSNSHHKYAKIPNLKSYLSYFEKIKFNNFS